MEISLLSLAACSFLLLISVDCQAKESTHKYCGQKLTNSLSLLCDGIYKRSEPKLYNSLDDEDDVLKKEEAAMQDFFRSREEALTMAHQHRRFRDKRQVVYECCRKSCSISELMSYCGSKD